MTIDGIIEEIVPDGQDVVLYLKGRKSDSAGARQLRIKHFTTLPRLGMEIWGDTRGITIEQRPSLHYKFTGPLTLEEIVK